MYYKLLADKNLVALKANLYPGRGIIVGLDETGKNLVQVYWIMGRSANSRNRVFVCEANGKVKTALVDPKEVKDTSLIIYTAMAEVGCEFAVSNGQQTEYALSSLGTLEERLDRKITSWIYEPDSPNFTPRITALLSLNGENPLATEISILKKSPFSENCDRYSYNLEVSRPSLGYCVTTYVGDGYPLPSFKGDPYLLPLKGDIKGVAQTIWDALNEENRVSLAVKFIDIKTGQSSVKIFNKYEVAAAK